MKYYVVKGDTVEYDYAQIGLFTDKRKMLDEVTEYIKGVDEESAKFDTENYGFSGIVYSTYTDDPAEAYKDNVFGMDNTLNHAHQDITKDEIYWDAEKKQAYLKE